MNAYLVNEGPGWQADYSGMNYMEKLIKYFSSMYSEISWVNRLEVVKLTPPGINMRTVYHLLSTV